MNQTDRFFQIIPPTTSGEHAVSNAATGAAASLDWAGGLSTDVPKGSCYIVVEANTYDVYVRFGSSATTATTANNGLLIKADQPGRPFWVDPVQHRYIDHYSPGGTGRIKVQVASKIGARNYQ